MLCNGRIAQLVKLHILYDLGHRDAVLVRPREVLYRLVLAALAPAVWTGIALHIRAALAARLNAPRLIVLHVLQQYVIAPRHAPNAAVSVAEVSDILRHQIIYHALLKSACVRLLLVLGGYVLAVLLLDVLLALRELNKEVIHIRDIVNARLRNKLFRMQQCNTQRAARRVRPLGVVPLDKEQVSAVCRCGSLVLIVQPLKRKPVQLIANIVLNGFRKLFVLLVSRRNLGRGNIARYFRLDDFRNHVPRNHRILCFLRLAMHLVDLVCAPVDFFPLDHQIKLRLVLSSRLA